MKTNPAYLTDPYAKELQTSVLEVSTAADGVTTIILSETIFYPMGGGQPTDQGVLKTSNGDIEIYQVMLVDNQILHYTKSNVPLNAGDTVTCQINWDRRYKNMKIHTAGHVIDFAVYVLGLSPNTLTPQKGDHGKNPHIIYSGTVGEDFKEPLQNKVNELVKQDMNFSWAFVELSELEKSAIYLQPGLPTNKPLRMLNLEGVGSVADGGTICKKPSEVGQIQILDITVEQGNTKISYSVQQDSPTDQKETSKKKTHSVTLQPEFQSILDEVENLVSTVKKEEELTNLWRKYLGKAGQVTEMLGNIINVDKDKRKEYGVSLNTLKNKIDETINSQIKNLKSKQAQNYLQTEHKQLELKKYKVGHLHPLTETTREINSILGRIGYNVYDGPELETFEYNFVRCNVPEDHPALDLQDSIYIKEPEILLRTQTSSVEARALETLKPPFKIVLPGRVYRNEKVNSSNHFTFHQYQLVCVEEKVSLVDLISTIDYLFKSFLGDETVVRYRNKYYPEVEPGVGPDMLCFNCKGDGCSICKHRGWLEMGGAGIIHPNIMRMAGLDTDKWQGFAFGLGLDRWAMAKYNIKDIRTLLGGNLAYKPFVG